MKIGIDAHNLEGVRTGVGRYLMGLLNEWEKLDKKDGVEFFLYFKDEIPQDLNFPDSFFLKKTSSFLGQKSNAFFTHWSLARMANKDEVDILFCPAYITPLFYTGKTVVVLHDIIYEARPDLHYWPSIWDRILLKMASKLSAKRSNVILTASNFSKGEIVKHYGVVENKVNAVYLGADDSFKKIEDMSYLEKMREKYDLPDSFVFFVGSIVPRRHLPEAINAFTRAARDYHNLHFIIVGGGYLKTGINKFIDQANEKLSRKAVRHIDVNFKDLPTLYNLAKVTIYLSDYEGFGLPVLESMQCGTPVITSESSSLIEVAGNAALMVKDNTNQMEIAKYLFSLISDNSLREEMARKGLERAKDFSWRRCAEKTLAIIQKAI